MSVWSRLKSLAGGRNAIDTLTVAATINVPDHANVFFLSGTDTVTAMNASANARVREVTFIGLSGTATFTNTDGATAAGTMDLGGSNRAVAATDVLTLLLRPDGTWLQTKGLVDN